MASSCYRRVHQPVAKCLIPRFDGAILSFEWKEAVWDRYVTSDRMRSLDMTTHAVRAAIQRSQASLSALSREFGINPKTVAKRATVEDLQTGPKAPHSTTLSEAEEAMVVAFRRHTLLPLACPRVGGGLPLRAVAIDPAPDAVSVASLPAAAWDLPPAGRRRRQTEAATLQALSDWFLPHRYRLG